VTNLSLSDREQPLFQESTMADDEARGGRVESARTGIQAPLIPRLISAYKRHGYSIRTGLNPFYMGEPDSAFTALMRDGRVLSTGWGLAPLEVLFVEQLLQAMPVKRRALVIGNAFGWSTLALAMSSPTTRVVAIDANLEGDDVLQGKALTLEIAREERLDVEVVDGFSPRDVPAIGGAYLESSIDFALLDGMHVSPQLVQDFEAALALAEDHCVFFLHDVLNWHMLDALDAIRAHPRVHAVHVLNRLPSGVGIVLLAPPPAPVADLIGAFVDETVDLDAWLRKMGATRSDPGSLTPRLSRGYASGRFWYELVSVEGRSLEERVERILRFVEQCPDEPATLFAAACHLFDLGCHAQAEPLFQRILRSSPRHAEVAHLLGRIAVGQGRVEAARDYFSHAASVEPTWTPPLYEHAALELRQARDDAARALLERLDTLEAAGHGDGAHVDAWCELLLRDRGEAGFSKALDRCIAQQRRDPRARLTPWERLDDALLGSHAPESLRARLEQAALDDPWIKPLLKLLGIARRLDGDVAGSLQALEHALSLAPRWSGALMELGYSQVLAGRLEEARGSFEAALEIRPSLERARAGLATLDALPAG
jgi:Flp pilus assembly protein TadD/predicted O-methyltransferase YrrM